MNPLYKQYSKQPKIYTLIFLFFIYFVITKSEKFKTQSGKTFTRDNVVTTENFKIKTQRGLLGAEHQTAVTKTRNISQDIRNLPVRKKRVVFKT